MAQTDFQSLILDEGQYIKRPTRMPVATDRWRHAHVTADLVSLLAAFPVGSEEWPAILA